MQTNPRIRSLSILNSPNTLILSNQMPLQINSRKPTQSHNQITGFQAASPPIAKIAQKQREDHLNGGPNSKGERDPVGEGDEPPLNRPSKEPQRDQEWQQGLVLKYMTQVLLRLLRVDAPHLFRCHFFPTFFQFLSLGSI